MRILKDLSYASLSFVKSELHYEYNLAADIMEKKLTFAYYNDICDNLYVFDEQTTAKFETRFQSLGNSEQFLWKLKETYVRNGDTAKETLKISFAKGDSAESVTKDITLPAKAGKDVSVTWASSEPEIVSAEGKVTRPEADAEKDASVKLTATLTRGNVTDTKIFNLTVIKQTTVTTDEDGTKRSVLKIDSGSIHEDTFKNGTVIKTILDKDGNVSSSKATDGEGKEITLTERKLPSNHVEGNNYELRLPLTELLPGEEFIKGDRIHFDMTGTGLCDMSFIYMYVVANSDEDGWTALGTEEDTFGIFGDSIKAGDTDVISVDYNVDYLVKNRDPKNVYLIIASNYPEGESVENGNHRDYVSILADIKATLDKSGRISPVTVNFSTPQGTCPSSVTMYPGQIISDEVENLPEHYFTEGWFDAGGNRVDYAPETNISLTAKISETKVFPKDRGGFSLRKEYLEKYKDAYILFIDEKLDSSTRMYRGIRLIGTNYATESNGDEYYRIADGAGARKIYYKDVNRLDANCDSASGYYSYAYSVQEIYDWAASFNVEYSYVTFYDWAGTNDITLALTYDVADITAKAWKAGEKDITAENVPCGFPIPNNSVLYGLSLYTDEACTDKVEKLSSEKTTLYQDIPDPVYSNSGKLKISYSKDVDGVIVTVIRPQEDVGKGFSNLSVVEDNTHVMYDDFAELKDTNSTAAEESFIFPFVQNGQKLSFTIVYQPSGASWFSETVETGCSVTGLNVNDYFDYSDGKLVDTVVLCAEDSYKIGISNDISKYIHFDKFDELKMSGSVVSGNTYWDPGTWVAGYTVYFDSTFETRGRDISYSDLLTGNYDLEPTLDETSRQKLASYSTWFLGGELVFKLNELPETQFKLKIKYTPDYLKEYKSYKFFAE